MKKLIYSVCSLENPQMGVILERTLEDKNDGHDVVFAYCRGVLPSCNQNADGNQGMCSLCHYMYKNIIEKYLGGVKIVPCDKVLAENKATYSFSRIEDLRGIKYRDVNIGMSILSYYISHTREMDGPMDAQQHKYFETLLTELTKFVDVAYNLIESEKPEVVAVYNARLYENRLFWDICQRKGIKFECLEVVGGPLWHEDKFYRVQYDGLPHNIHNYQLQIDHVWNDPSRSLEQKIEIGSSFYYKRRSGQPAADIIFTKNMVDDLLPDDFDKSKKNIVIFNSSDDEKAALGGEWDEGKLFSTQYDAIEFVAKNAPKDTHVYLRVHPNLSKIKYSYHIDLYKLKKYSNLTIIEPTSPINSYALMDVADQVVVFGSAMGVEGCFWGKPVLLLWKSLYYELDTCYVPKSHEELKQMLSSDLQPKDKVNAIKYGLYNLDRSVRVLENKYININNEPNSFLGINYHVVDFLRIMGSRRIYKIVKRFLAPKFYYRFSKCVTPFPKKITRGTQSAT